MRTCCLLMALAVVACGNKKTKDEPTGTSKVSDAAPVAKTKPGPPDAAPTWQSAESDCVAGKVTVSVADRYDCTADEDCIATCAWGSINYRSSTLLEDNCDDGCASKGLHGKCVKNKCTTFDYQDKRVDGCNDIATPEDVCVDRAVADDANRCQVTEKLVPTWNRFTCKKDDDCLNSCRYGAIHRTWFDRLGAGCKDGCSSKGMYAKCIADRCVAFDRKDQRADHCTNKAAPEAICITK